jgi:hypothetical protein
MANDDDKRRLYEAKKVTSGFFDGQRVRSGIAGMEH